MSYGGNTGATKAYVHNGYLLAWQDREGQIVLRESVGGKLTTEEIVNFATWLLNTVQIHLKEKEKE